MSMHDEISQALRTAIESMSGTKDISPGIVANICCEGFGANDSDVHVRWAAIEYCKNMARRILSGRFEQDDERNESHQSEMFSGHLQERYPIKRAPGADPIYRSLQYLSLDDLDWNVQQLRKSSIARELHARALQGFRDQVARDLENAA